MKRLATLLLFLVLPACSWADTFVQQATFNVPFSSISGMDEDSLGNIYVLGLPPGSATYWVTAYQPPNMAQLFSFNTGLGNPWAFAVEATGTVDVLDGANGFTINRFTNSGTPISHAGYNLGSVGVMSAAIDKTNARAYFGFQQYVHLYCTLSLGGTCPAPGYEGFVAQYDLQGNSLGRFDMQGISSVGGCYTPSKLAADPQGNVYVADNACLYLLKYSSTGSLLTQTTGSQFSNWFQTRAMWTDPQSNLYLSNPIGNVEGIVKVSPSAQVLASLVVDSPVGLGWDNRTLYLTSSGGSSLQRFIFDSPPTVPTETSPLVPVTQHSATATLTWQASTDPDGDPITYNVYLGNSPSQLALIGSTLQTTMATPTLSFGVPYYWQVVAQASYLTMPTLTQSAPIAIFTLNFVDSPPGAFTASAGTGSAVTRSTSVTLGWTASVDQYGDPLTYNVYWQNPSQSSLSLLGSTTAASWTVNGLGFGATYYWSVTAVDPYGASTPMSGGKQSYFPVFLDSPPGPVVYQSASSVYNLHTTSPAVTLGWSAAPNAEGDPVSYQLNVNTSTGAWPAEALGAATSATLGVQFETTYYWRVEAADPYGGVSTGAWNSFIVHLFNQPPYPIVVTSTNTLTTRATSYALAWANTGDPDGDAVTYNLALSTSPAALSLVQSSTATSYPLNFQFGTTYYWQVTALDGYGGVTASVLQTFLPMFLDPPPTVPVNQSKIGTIPYHGFNPSQSFFWGSSTDPNGDPFTYNLYYGTNSSHMSVTTSVPLGYTISNLPLNTAFYYQIVATDIYGASSPSPVNWVYYQFTNNLPGSFDVLGTTGAVATRSTSATLSWTASADPDGDLVTYGVLVGTSPASLSTMTQTTKTSTVLSGMNFGTTYYWLVNAYDGYDGTTTVNEGVQSLVYLFYDPPASPIVYLSTASSYSLHTTSPVVVLAWQPSTNSAGDPITYGLTIQTGTGTWPTLAMGSSTAFSLPVVFETTYSWQVAAYDPFGGASTGAWQSFIVHLANRPPNPIVYESTNTLLTRATSYMLAWQDTGDPDGDAYFYSLCLSTVPQAQYLVQRGTQTAYLLNFTFGTTYYWRVSDTDSFGARTDGALQTFLPIFQNSPPLPFAVLSGTGTLMTRTTSQVLAWSQAADPDGDSVAYALALSTTPGFLPTVQISSSTSYLLAFAYGTTYYWSVSAFDGFGGTTTITGGTQSFLPLFLNAAPGAPDLVSPFSGSPVVTTMNNYVTVSWNQVSDPQGDAITYTVYLGESAGNMQALASIGPAGQSGAGLALKALELQPQTRVSTDSDTVTLSLTDLNYYKTYYLQVAASNPYGATTMTPVQTFSLAAISGFPPAYNYPNPFSPTRGGTNIVFNAPPSGYARATVEIYSEWQDLLFKQDYFNIAPGISQVHFNGRDRNGRAFFNGSYICRVTFSGPDDKQIFYMLVVK